MIRKIIERLRWWYHLPKYVADLDAAVDDLEVGFSDTSKKIDAVRKDSVSHDQVKALQMLDENWHDCGKIILAFHIKEQDIIKIIDVKRKTTMMEYIHLSKRLEAEYGIPPKYVDAFMPKHDWFKTYKEGRF